MNVMVVYSHTLEFTSELTIEINHLGDHPIKMIDYRYQIKVYFRRETLAEWRRKEELGVWISRNGM